MEELLAREPDNPYFLELMGQIYFENGLAEQAIAPYRAAIAQKPDDVLFRIGLAQALLNRGKEGEIDQSRLGEAEKALIFATSREPRNALAWMLRAVIYEQMGNRGMTQLATAEARYITGAYRESYQRAQQAVEELPEGSVESRRAKDLVIFSRNQETVDRALRQRDNRR